jgi:hypothetical protein
VYFIAKCLKCKGFKAENKHPIGLLQPFPIPKWKWEVVTMDFITKFLRTSKQHDSIMVAVDMLNKFAHFVLVKSNYMEPDVDEIYMCEVAKMHGVEIASSPQSFGKGYSRDLEQV